MRSSYNNAINGAAYGTLIDQNEINSIAPRGSTNIGEQYALPVNNIVSDTDSDPAVEELAAMVTVSNDSFRSLPQVLPGSIPGIQRGSVVFFTDGSSHHTTRAFSLNTVNTLLYMLCDAEPQHFSSIERVSKLFRLGGVMTTEASARASVGQAHVVSNTAGNRLSTCRIQCAGKWQDTVDVWSDTRSLFDEAKNPEWAQTLLPSIATELSDQVCLTVALLGMNRLYIEEGRGAPFAAIADIVAAGAANNNRRSVVFQMVPIPFKPGTTPSVCMLGDHLTTPASVAAMIRSHSAGYTVPAALWRIGYVHMRNHSEVQSSVPKYQIPRRTLFATTMGNATTALELVGLRRKLPVMVRTKRLR